MQENFYIYYTDKIIRNIYTKKLHFLNSIIINILNSININILNFKKSLFITRSLFITKCTRLL